MNKITATGLTVIISICVYIIHKILFVFFLSNGEEKLTVYSLELLYLFFGMSSLLIVFVLKNIAKKNVNNVGYTFLVLTSLKMAAAYFFLRPILNTESPNSKFEKINFIVVFIVFLSVETLITIRILNKKQ